MYNQNYSGQSQPSFKILTIIHAALMAGQLLFAVVVFSITQNNGINYQPGSDPLFYIAILLTVGGMIAGTFVSKTLLGKIDVNGTLRQKLMAYQTALIPRWAFTEGASLFCIVCYMLSGNLFYLILVGLNVIWFWMIRPTKKKAKADLNLNYEEETAI
jgi:hypothetical protein